MQLQRYCWHFSGFSGGCWVVDGGGGVQCHFHVKLILRLSWVGVVTNELYLMWTFRTFIYSTGFNHPDRCDPRMLNTNSIVFTWQLKALYRYRCIIGVWCLLCTTSGVEVNRRKATYKTGRIVWIYWNFKKEITIYNA